MTAVLASIFTTPIFMTGHQHALLLLPLCLSIAVVYKTSRCADVRDIPLTSLVLWATIVLGMYAVGVGLWALSLLLA